MIVNAKQLTEFYDIDRRTVTNWVNSDPPCPSWLDGRERKFDTAKVARWREERAAAQAAAEVEYDKPADFDSARARKMLAEAKLAEIELAEKTGDVVPMDVHTKVVGEIAGALRAVALNIPGNFSVDLERAGVEANEAQSVLEKLSEKLTESLRRAVEGIPEEEE